MFDWLLGRSHVVREGYAGLIYRDGVFTRQVGPGRHRLAGRETLTTAITAPQLLVVGGQEVLSADGFQPRLTAIAAFAVTDAHRAASSGESGYREMLTVEVQLALRALAAARPAEDLLRTPRETLEAELLAAVAASATALGLTLASVRLRDVVLPADFRRLLTGVEKARREGQAALERAGAEQAALRSLANAARMLRNNPELQTLRLIQALGEAKAATVVLGPPSTLPPAAPALQPGEG